MLTGAPTRMAAPPRVCGQSHPPIAARIAWLRVTMRTADSSVRAMCVLNTLSDAHATPCAARSHAIGTVRRAPTCGDGPTVTATPPRPANRNNHDWCGSTV